MPERRDTAHESTPAPSGGYPVASTGTGQPAELDPGHKWAARAERYRDYAAHAQGPFSMLVLPLAACFCEWRAGR